MTLFATLLPASVVVAYAAPHQGDYFSYHEVENLGSGMGSYAGYTEQTAVNGTERINGVGPDGIVSANYSYSWAWRNSTGSKEAGSKSGSYTFSSDTFLYVNGTDDQTGYVNPTVWFYMNDSVPTGGTFELLNTQMTVVSKNYSYYLPSRNGYVAVISSQGTSSYLRNDQYGKFNATYTWNAYFDPSTGYIVGYAYVEHDTNSSGAGFTYTDTLYATSTSYPLVVVAGTAVGTTTASSPAPADNNSTQYLAYAAGLAIVLVVAIGILIYALSRGRRRNALPKHPYQAPSSGPPPDINLIPEQPPEQIVIKEVVKVPCKYCGTLIDSTATVCPQCGAPRT